MYFDRRIRAGGDISKYFPGVLALNKMQLHLKKGEVMALVGENGRKKHLDENTIRCISAG